MWIAPSSEWPGNATTLEASITDYLNKVKSSFQPCEAPKSKPKTPRSTAKRGRGGTPRSRVVLGELDPQYQPPDPTAKRLKVTYEYFAKDPANAKVSFSTTALQQQWRPPTCPPTARMRAIIGATVVIVEVQHPTPLPCLLNSSPTLFCGPPPKKFP